MHAGFVPTPEEVALLADCLRYANAQASRIVPTDSAMDLFDRSGLPEADKREIWAISDKDRNGMLTSRELGVALRLIGWVQAGEPLTELLVELPGPLPTLQGISDVPRRQGPPPIPPELSPPPPPSKHRRGTSDSALSHSPSRSLPSQSPPPPTFSQLSPIELDNSKAVPIVFPPTAPIRSVSFLTSPRSSKRRAQTSLAPEPEESLPPDVLSARKGSFTGPPSSIASTSTVSLPLTDESSLSSTSCPSSNGKPESQSSAEQSTRPVSEQPGEPSMPAAMKTGNGITSSVLDAPPAEDGPNTLSPSSKNPSPEVIEEEDINPFYNPPSPPGVPPSPLPDASAVSNFAALSPQSSSSKPAQALSTPPLPHPLPNPEQSLPTPPSSAPLESSSTGILESAPSVLSESRPANQTQVHEEAPPPRIEPPAPQLPTPSEGHEDTNAETVAQLKDLLAASDARVKALEKALRESEVMMEQVISTNERELGAVRGELESYVLQASTVETTQAELTALKAELVAAKDAAASAKADAQKEREENENYKEEAKKWLTSNDREIFELEKRLSEARDECLESSASVTKLTAENARLGRLCQEHERSLAVSAKRIEELESVVQGLQAPDVLEDLMEAAVENAEARADLLQAALEETRQTVDTLREERDRKDRELASAQREIDLLKREMAELRRPRQPQSETSTSVRAPGADSGWTFVSATNTTGAGRRGDVGTTATFAMYEPERPPPVYEEAVMI